VTASGAEHLQWRRVIEALAEPPEAAMADERNMTRQRNGHGAGPGSGLGASEASEALGQQASNAAEQMGRVVEQGVGKANAALSSVTEQSGKAAERTGEVIGNFRSALETSAKSQPTTTVLLAAFVGFVFGSLWRIGSR
jgi:hypothetical protein